MLPQPFASFATYVYESPKLQVRAQSKKGGHGLFASEPIPEGEVS